MMDNTIRRVVATHDGLLTICTGSSRRTKVWKAKQIAWSQLIQRLKVTKRTNETQAEFMRMSKVKQDEIKDVGGFVGGELEEGKRTALTVGNRQIVTLDADYADSNLWDLVEMFFGEYACCCYSTHKHTPEKPRLRLVIPLDRPVGPDEYQAISRKIAEGFGIDNFDDTTYQPHRLMYWPSTSADADYFFRWQDGQWLSADKVLAEYDDWQDQATWPVSSRQGDIVKREIKKQEDPLEKKGLIGTFCRAYNIQEAMETFLPDVYEPCAGHNDDRYTFKAGTSSGGAVVYEGKWLYSFHATDPCSLQLVNAFDLVRIHKFGGLDEGKAGQDITKMPSYSAMMELVKEDGKVKSRQVKEQLAEAREEFEDLGDEEDLEKKDYDWVVKLKMNGKGRVLPTRANIRVILENDPHIKGTFGWDDFASRVTITRPPSWCKEDDVGRAWGDKDDAALRHFMETRYGIEGKEKLLDEVTCVADKNSFHRVREYLKELSWDGVPRIETLFIDYLGAKDSPYTRAVTRKMLIAAVGRVMKPGLKFDTMVVLQGRQGIGKSMLLKELGRKWFSDSLDTMSGKDAYEQLRGMWIIEVGELAALRANEIEAVKKFISKQVDSYRVAYGHRTQDFPRQCILVGTTNEMSFLKDKTGNRRFLPIEVGVTEPQRHPWDEGFHDIADQAWAEALKYWNDGESVWIGKELEKEAQSYQERHMEENPLEGMVAEYLDMRVPANWYKTMTIQDRRDFIRGQLDLDMTGAFVRDRICTAEIWCELLCKDMSLFKHSDRKNLNDIMRSVPGWKIYDGNTVNRLCFGVYGRQRAYVRITEE